VGVLVERVVGGGGVVFSHKGVFGVDATANVSESCTGSAEIYGE
jgi:hypothetical protein